MLSDELLAGAFKHAFSALPLGMCLVDSDFSYVAVNDAWCEFIGYSRTEVEDRSFLSFTHDDDRELDATLSRRLFDGEIPYFRIHKRWVSKSGEVVSGLLTATCLNAENKEQWGFALIVPESHLGKRVQEQKNEWEATLGVRVRGVAHDISNMLLVVSGRTELLESEFGEHHDLSAIHSATKLAADHTKTLLLNSLPADEGEATDINNLLVDFSLVLKPMLPTSIDLQINGYESELVANIAKPKLIQVLMNLVMNAIDAIDDAGWISINISYSERCRSVLILVEDTGCGIDSSVINQVVEPFFTTKSADRGSGLGLSIVDSTIKEAHGKLELTNRPGGGTKVLIELPGLRVS